MTAYESLRKALFSTNIELYTLGQDFHDDMMETDLGAFLIISGIDVGGDWVEEDSGDYYHPPTFRRTNETIVVYNVQFLDSQYEPIQLSESQRTELEKLYISKISIA